jgi:hypothetical protein
VFHTAFIPKRCRSGTVVYKRLTRDEDGHVVQLSDPQISDLLDYRPGQLKRVIPPQLGFLTHLKVLNLSSCGIRGEIPSTIGDLRCLQHLTLGHNMLTGTIPVTLSNLGELRTLDLGNNCLTGSFDMICELGHLTAAYLLHNRLSGVLPPLLKMPSLNRLALQYNSFTGPFPNELPDTIEMLQLSHNNLTGEFINTEQPKVNPISLYLALDFDGVVLPSSLRWLYLDHNSFTPGDVVVVIRLRLSLLCICVCRYKVRGVENCYEAEQRIRSYIFQLRVTYTVVRCN